MFASRPQGRTCLSVALAAAALLLVSACATSPSASSSSSPSASNAPAEAEHGQLTELSRVDGPIVLCDHQVPASVCTRHNPQLVAEFKRANDWCAPHGIPESQCFECHPDLTFEPLPTLAADADVAWLAKKGEDVPDLDAHAVKGKVTVFDFYADWCAACRKVDGHVYKRLAGDDRTVAYRKINIVSWESPVAQRYMQEVPSLPLLVVYGKDGKRFKALHGADLSALDAAIREASAQ